MSEGRLRSLEKFFFFGEEMLKWRRKIKVKMRVNSVNGGRKKKKKKKKKKKRERERDKESGGPKFGPHT